MIAEAALKLAGDNARLVARPTGVAHVYTGPLTPSGRFVPRSARTVCRVHTRQLRALSLPERWTSLTRDAAQRRLCARCQACLGRDRDRPRQATTPCSRQHWVQQYSDTTKADVAFALEVATTPDEVDRAAWLSLLLFDVAGCNVPFSDRGRDWPPLHRLVCLARSRVHGYPEEAYRFADLENVHAAAARATRSAELKQARTERDDRIRRIGITNAIPEVRRPARP